MNFVPTRLVAGAIVALGLLASAAKSQNAGGAAPAKRPNILFIFTDDHASRAISAYGSQINKTPNIDRIAREGMRFDRCLVTNSICGPSRACILTGKYSHKNGFFRNGNRFDGGQVTFPKILRKNGYATAMIGKWHLSSDPTGFDYWQVLRGQGPYYNPNMKSIDGPVKHIGYTTDIITDLGLKWLKKGRGKDKPFMLMLQHKAPHRNWQPGPKYLNMYDGETIPEPPTLFDDYQGRASPASNQKMTVAKHLTPNDLKFRTPRNLTPEQLKVWNAAYGPKNAAFEAANLTGKDLVRWKYQRYIKDYLRCVASVDDNIGRVLNYLDDTGLAKNTIVIYSSDQGWYLGDHGWYDKRWMYEESLIMPFVVRWPGVIEAGTTNRDLISNVDFAETFLDMAGCRDQIPGDMQGRSILPILKGQTP
ncbi:MAG: sulfatase, partial [Planctomycetota bacterium]|nr:sulfatase [Planctomycetota bacterium]